MPGDECDGQPRERRRDEQSKRTCEDGYDGLVYRCDLLLLHDVAGEERYNEQHDGDEEGP